MRFRPIGGFTWVAEDDAGAVVARAEWWSPPGAERPEALDALEADSPDAAVALLRAGHEAFGCRPDYHLFAGPDWRDDPEVAWRIAAAEAAGLTDLLERLRFRWRPSAGVPDDRAGLSFRAGSDDEFAAVFAHFPDEDVDVYRSMPGDRAWWRLAVLPGSGEVVGVAVPSRNFEGVPVVGFVGVLADWRGRGYADALLGEVTRILAAAGAEEVRADTDASNTRMARTFLRAGWEHFAVRLVLRAPTPSR